MNPEAIQNMLTPKQQTALPLILSGMSSLEVSKKIGVKASTVSEWLHHSPAFRASLAALRRETVERTLGAIDFLVMQSLGELARIMSSSKSDAVRLKACELVISKLIQRAEDCPENFPFSSGEINIPLILKGLGYDK